jgi:hypothetical protein
MQPSWATIIALALGRRDRRHCARRFDGLESLVTNLLKSRRESQAAEFEMWRRAAVNLILIECPEMPAAQRILKSSGVCPV